VDACLLAVVLFVLFYIFTWSLFTHITPTYYYNALSTHDIVSQCDIVLARRPHPPTGPEHPPRLSDSNTILPQFIAYLAICHSLIRTARANCPICPQPTPQGVEIVSGVSDDRGVNQVETAAAAASPSIFYNSDDYQRVFTCIRQEPDDEDAF
jgi:hypothetical protein